MNTQVIILDPEDQSRMALIKNLEELKSFQISSVSNFNEGFAKIESSADFKGFIFIKLTDQLKSYTDRIIGLRAHNPEAILLVYGSLASLENMKQAMQLRPDQAMMDLVSASQLKDKMLAAEKFRKQILTSEDTQLSRDQFEAQVDSLVEGYYRVYLSGSLTESFHLPEIKPSKESVLFIDCDLLRVINSVGIRTWLVWMKSLTENGFTKIEFENLGPGFLQLASFVENFIPKNGSVNSFYLHYWSDDDQKKNFRFYSGKDFDSQKMTIPESFEIFSNGSKALYKIDDAATIILRFYKGKIQIVS